MTARSLSFRLFVRIAPTVGVVILCAGVLAFFSATREIARVYDARMIDDANVLWAIVSDEVKEQEQESSAARAIGDVDFSVGNQLAINDFADDEAGAHMFRVWRGKQVVMLSHGAPTAALPAGPAGFSDVSYGGDIWRIYSLPLPKTEFSIEVGEKGGLRESLVGSILLDLSAPLLLLMPLIAIMIWIGINSGLGGLRTLTRQIGARSARDMSPVGAEGMPRDLAPLAQSVNQLLDRLEKSFQAEKRFVDHAAHCLRTPLAALKLQLQMLARSGDEAERKALLGDLLRSNDRAGKLVGQLLTSARLERQDIELKPVALSAVISSVMADLGVLAAHKHIEMSFDGRESAQVMAEEALLRLLLENLIENAIKYTPPRGTVQVSAVPAERAWTVRILDSGPGIPEDQRDLVFDRFYRVGHPAEEGSGLGLSIVAEILRRFSGTIKLKGHEGPGLLAEVQLPAA